MVSAATRQNLIGLCLTILLTTSVSSDAAEPRVVEADVVVYGGTSGGVVAAVAARRMGKTAVIVEPGRHLGGMTSGGLSWTDVGSSPKRVRAIGGMAREVYRRIGARYGMAPGTEFDAPANDDPTRTGVDFAKPPSLSFEPHVAEAVFGELVREAEVEVYFDSPLATVKKDGAHIRELATAGGDVFRGRVFVDATYEGDLLAAAGVSFTVGRESNDQYGETVDGVQGPAESTRAGKFDVAVDPFRTPGDPASGPLPYLLQAGELEPHGSADKRVQSYNYRLTLTDRAERRTVCRSRRRKTTIRRTTNYWPAGSRRGKRRARNSRCAIS